MRRRNYVFGNAIAGSHVLATLFLTLGVSAAAADVPVAPTPEVAQKCMIYSYRVYPYKRPGSVKGSPARGMYMRDCVAKGGNVPEPPEPPKPAPKPAPRSTSPTASSAAPHPDEAPAK